MMCMEVPVQSVVRHSKSVHESKAVEEIKSGVSKIQMHLLAAEESRSHETERNSFPGEMLQNFGNCLLLFLECGFKDQLRQNVQLLAPQSWKCCLDISDDGGKGKTFLMGIHAHLVQKHTLRLC